jgi:TatD DNase family protein
MPAIAPYIDMHTHSTDPSKGIVAVHCLELADVAVSVDMPRFCSVGRHPWHAAMGWSDTDGLALDAALARPQCIALGEVGLDRAKGPAFELQMKVLEAQLDVAARRGLPVIFHCVRAHADLMQLRKRRGANDPWIIHGFAGHGELAGQLLRMDFHLSFGAALLSVGAKAREALTQVPLDRLFLETDESGLDATVIYRTASSVLGLPIADLRKVISANFRALFGTQA